MYILVNEDIKINKGKLAGQVGHAVTVFLNDVLKNYYPLTLQGFNTEQYNDYDEWYKFAQKKIILYHSQTQLEKLEAEGFIAIRDKGYTDLKPNTLTCVNLGVLDKNNIPNQLEFIKELKLCR